MKIRRNLTLSTKSRLVRVTNPGLSANDTNSFQSCSRYFFIYVDVDQPVPFHKVPAELQFFGGYQQSDGQQTEKYNGIRTKKNIATISQRFGQNIVD